MGRTAIEGPGAALLDADGRPEGWASPDGRVWGTYLHGLFDSGAARRHVLDWARSAAATPDSGAFSMLDAQAERQRGYDRLADALEAAFDPSVLRRLTAP